MANQLGKSACNFSGVVCNSNGFVTEINLPQQQIVGYLPFDSICELQALEKIDVGNNSFHGKISEDLKKCSGLQYLDLGCNAFSGEVPDLSSLNGLKFLNLNNSGFSGIFPWKSLENLTELTFLSLGDNPFAATPFPVELYNNSLSGKIPVGFGNLTNLKYFDASMNRLEGDLSELRSLKNLVSLQLLENQFSGEVPVEFGEFKHLEGLSLYRNKLTGQLPPKIGSWSDLNFIDVSENFFTGPIPPDMCKNGKMVDLLLLQNNFTGTLPESYANCKSLVRLRVNNNSLSGTVPAGIWSLPNLLIIDLTMNRFEGPVAGDIGNAKSLAQLFLANNQFSGELPASISQATSLVSIQLTSNKFSGQIPGTIGELKRLGSFYLNGNMFSGVIPDSLGSCVSLNDVNLAGNSLSGKIPESIGSLRNLNSLNLSENKLSGHIPTTLSPSILSLLDLSNNRLVGPIPKSLSIQAFKDCFKGNPGLCSSDLDDFQPCSSSPGTSSHLRTFLSCFIAGALVLLVSLGCYMFIKVRKSNLDHPLKQGSWNMKSYRMLSFTEKDIIDAIKSENLIGKGGSGNVYKVELEDGKELAVKHIWTSDSGNRKNYHSSTAMLTQRNSRNSGSLEYDAEVAALSAIRHVNVVKLYCSITSEDSNLLVYEYLPNGSLNSRNSGSLEYDAEVAALSAIRHVNVVKLYCSITSEDSNLLVYEYLPNGSLWDRLHSCHKMELDWEMRYAIAIGAAKGLEYLHHGCDRPVIHRDVKSSNILLDEEWKPRIADFGLAKIVQNGSGGDWTHVIAGTHGYMAPEYAYTCKINEKSDVYSFGVVLMELVTGKRPVEPEFGENKDIVYWIYNKLKTKETLVEAVDPKISMASKEDAIKVLRIAVHCTAKIPALRPSMRKVVQMLEEAEPCKLTDIIVHEKVLSQENNVIKGAVMYKRNAMFLGPNARMDDDDVSSIPLPNA
ncbi:hypothetical protein GOBAR_AA12603 [Gossypium barbadense]|uniref:non-specific serine/threonine protein kinase n=1 Tax=Gossypium barbadense TaxID=3634 RepID=A0A2P5XXI3_GOSBA|nr:hypothetical protein GOBAR_AA12603 [Gossypium barbadense]